MRTKVLFIFASLLAAGSAYAQELPSDLLYSGQIHGEMVLTGNALGLNGKVDANCMGPDGTIRAFMSMDPTSVDMGVAGEDVCADPAMAWSALGGHTTGDWRQNGSFAVLDVPAGAVEVLYAGLIWSGSWRNRDEAETAAVEAALETKVTFRHEVTKEAYEIAPLIIKRPAGIYHAYADVTAEVQETLLWSGEPNANKYSVNGVPATQGVQASLGDCAGWALAVVYRTPSNPQARHIALFLDGNTSSGKPATTKIDGFCAPQSGELTGKVFVTGMEGDVGSIYTADSLGIAKTKDGPFVNMFGPNNPEDGFFSGQINGSDGLLDTRGLFGDRNNTLTENVPGARFGIDITTLTLQPDWLSHGDTAAYIQTNPVGEAITAGFIGLQIHVYTPNFEGSVLETASGLPGVGETFIASLRLTNALGATDATRVLIKFDLPDCLNVTGYTIGGVRHDADRHKLTIEGIELPDGIKVGAAETIKLELKLVEAPPEPGTVKITAHYDYWYRNCGNEASDAYHASDELSFMPHTACGDGIRDEFEECDDGNDIDGDGCTNCKVDPGYECNAEGDCWVVHEDGCGCRIMASDGRRLPIVALIMMAFAATLAFVRRRKDNLTNAR